ncbi:hypothetical protein [Streptomyces sp. NPDC059786]|uniref:hypothetical protein n=1 Tax=Streptomyces sp. NPDC059786 TaxID=3346946 RepID=UPI00364B3396
MLAAVFAVLQLANVTGRDTPDTKNYLSYALSLRGDGKRAAAAATIDYACAGRASIARRNQSVDVLRFHRPSPTRRVTEECRREQWAQVDRRLRAGQTAGRTVPFMPARFMRIFEVRPGYPALLVPFIAVFGVTWGLWASGVTVAVAGGVLAFLTLRTLRAPTVVALTGQALFYVLPCGATAMRPMTEGLMLTLTLAALWGCALALEGGRARTGAALVGGALAWLFTVKHSQALFLGLCLAAACAAIGLRRAGGVPDRAAPGAGPGTEPGAAPDSSTGAAPDSSTDAVPGSGPGGVRVGVGVLVRVRRAWAALGRPLRAVALVAGGAAVATVLAARALRYPAESESLQDLLTDHFGRPDRIRPWPEFLRLEAGFWVEWLRRQLWEPLFLTALLAAAWGALRRRPAFGCFLLAGAFTGVLNQAGHPDINIYGDRLIVLAWLLPVLGLPLLLERATRPPAPLPGTVPGPLRRDTAPVR